MIEPLSNLPAGFGYYTGAQARARRSVAELCLNVLQGWAYEAITTPLLDYYTLFESGLGRDSAHHAFRLTDRDGRLLALRPEVTSQVARGAATLWAGRERPLRFSYQAQVFQQRPRSHADWRRETVQIGGELIGSGGLLANLETLLIIVEILEKLGLRDAGRITLNHAALFRCAIEQLHCTAPDRELLAKLVGARAVPDVIEYLQAKQAPPMVAEALCQLMRPPEERPDVAKLRRLLPDGAAALNELEEIWRVLTGLGIAALFTFDPGDVPEPEYYTGLLCKVYLRGAGLRVGSGGRYDGLTAHFGRPEPAVGFALELDSLADIWLLQQVAEQVPSATQPEPVAIKDTLGSLQDARRRRSEGRSIKLLSGGNR